MSESTIHRCCTFRVGEACFALPADGVVEVLRGGSLARVPRAPEGVLGLLHLRGRIVPIIDPAAQLGISRVTEQRATHLVIELQDDWYGLVIDEMLDVVEIPADRVEQAATPATEAGGDSLIGVFAAQDRLVHLIDPQRMIHSLTRLRPQAPERQGVSHGRS